MGWVTRSVPVLPLGQAPYLSASGCEGEAGTYDQITIKTYSVIIMT